MSDPGDRAWTGPLYGAAAFLFFSGLMSAIHSGEAWSALFAAGVAALFVGLAQHPLALRSPREGMRWHSMPARAKRWHLAAALCCTAGAVLRYGG